MRMEREERPRIFEAETTPLEGNNLVEAAAGTGKTYSIAILVLRLVVEKGWPLERILVVTFTNAATAELLGRVRSFLKEALDYWTVGRPAAPETPVQAVTDRVRREGDAEHRLDVLRESYENFDRASIFTIHGFCLRVLTEYAFESGVLDDTDMVGDEAELLQKAARNFWRRKVYGLDDFHAGLLVGMGITPSTLERFLGVALGTPAVQLDEAILRLASSSPETGPEGAWEEIKACWETTGAEVKEILRESGALKRNKEHFHPDVIPDLFAAVDRCLREETPDLRLFSKLSASNIRKQTKKGCEPPVHPFFDACERLVTATRSFAARLFKAAFEEGHQDLEDLKRRRNAQTYNDLLLRIHDVVTGSDRVARRLRALLRNRYRAALVDEFQDTDLLQYRIFEEIFGASEENILFYIGDPKQSIYRFRGADIYAYRRAAARAAARYTLQVNYRSTPRFIEAVNRLFQAEADPPGSTEPGITPFPYHRVEAHGIGARLEIDGEEPPPLALIDFQETGPLPKRSADNLLLQASVMEILSLLEKGTRGEASIVEDARGARPLEPQDIAVLTRTNDEAKAFKDLLTYFGVPSVLYSGTSVFASPTADDLLILLHAVLHPGDLHRGRAALLTPLFSAPLPEVARTTRDPQVAERWADRFQAYGELWNREGFAAMFARILREVPVRRNLLAAEDGERRITNLMHLLELLSAAALENGFTPAQLLAWFESRRDEPERDEATEQRMESDAKALKIMTIHKSKGLQFPVVFAPYFHRGPGREKVLKYHSDREERLEVTIEEAVEKERFSAARDQSLREAREEELRLFYVAVTRAKFRCYLARYTPSRRTREAEFPSPMRFYLEEIDQALPRDLLEVLDGPRRVQALKRAARYRTAEGSGRRAEARTFRGRIDTSWGITSFSRLAGPVHARPPAREPEEPRDVDTGDGVPPPVPGEKAGAGSFLRFPGGARTGSAVHAVFERIDFTGTDHRAVIEQVLAAYNVGRVGAGTEEAAVSAVEEMVRKTLARRLPQVSPRFTLSQLSPADRIAEMEFYFPVSGEQIEILRRIARERGIEVSSETVRGFLRGFIDLVFLAEGRYFLLDWKTNNLGESPRHYDPDALEVAMRENAYTLQYLIYTTALHAHLRRTLAHYDYDRHFGGVFYLFLRGIDAAPEDERCGLFFDKPPKAVIEAIAAAVGPGEEGGG